MHSLKNRKIFLFSICLCHFLLFSLFTASLGVNPSDPKITSTRARQINNRQRKVAGRAVALPSLVGKEAKINNTISKNEKRNVPASVNITANVTANNHKQPISTGTRNGALTLAKINESHYYNETSLEINHDQNMTNSNITLALIGSANVTNEDNHSILVPLNETTPERSIRDQENVTHGVNNETVISTTIHNIDNETSTTSPNITNSSYPTLTPIGDNNNNKPYLITSTPTNSSFESLSTDYPMGNSNPKTPTINSSTEEYERDGENFPNEFEAHQSHLSECDLYGDILCEGFVPKCFGSGEIDCTSNEDPDLDSRENEADNDMPRHARFTTNRHKRSTNESDYDNHDLKVAEDVVNLIIKSPQQSQDPFCFVSPYLACSPLPSRKNCLGKGVCRMKLSASKIDAPIQFWKVGLVAGLAAIGGVIFVFVVIIAYVSYNKLKVRPDSQSMEVGCDANNQSEHCTRI